MPVTLTDHGAGPGRGHRQRDRQESGQANATGRDSHRCSTATSSGLASRPRPTYALPRRPAAGSGMGRQVRTIKEVGMTTVRGGPV
ncbi:hypothetical protein Asi03nite_01590 [Actinoplanes siamensis]|uniref:Uncharacterized protein n=1 Tax=Actinoplanes siamensis TaxID=1223317 RepID=A0A919N1X8_9ACTN|nr:hypothetical protein Asi03nite_01590 [Actinoplanes siamensis]